MLLGTSNIMTLGQVLDDLLSGPTAREQSSLGLRKAPFDIGNKSIIGTGSAELVRILEIEGFVGAACTKIMVSMYTKLSMYLGNVN
jgi:hypothetical protein